MAASSAQHVRSQHQASPQEREPECTAVQQSVVVHDHAQELTALNVCHAADMRVSEASSKQLSGRWRDGASGLRHGGGEGHLMPLLWIQIVTMQPSMICQE